jgi:hypothetical protein
VRFSQSRKQIVFTPSAATDDHRQTFELRVAQQFDGGVKRVHVEVGDTAHFRHRVNRETKQSASNFVSLSWV